MGDALTAQTSQVVRTSRRHAVVIGGSLAGLLAAHVLAQHAERVTVVERDRTPENGEPRAGVPQGRHLHALLESGQAALERLLPGFRSELRAQGAPLVGIPGDIVQWQNGWLRRTESTLAYFTGARPRLEALVRRRVLASERITQLAGAEVVGLDGDAARVRGVRLRERGTQGDGEERVVAADLVVDASGRGSKAPSWLTELGAEAPHKETIDTGLAYATRVYRHPSGKSVANAAGYFLLPNHTQTVGCVVMPIEEPDHFLVTFSGLRGDEPPVGDAEFAAFAERLPHPIITEWLAGAEPVSRAHGFRQTANVRHRYDRARTPAGFLATGDALCTFNPIYGQGMSVAALGAVALDDALADTRHTPTTRRVQRSLLAASDTAWMIAAGADKGLPGAVGNAVEATPVERLVGGYLARIQARALSDPEVGKAFRQVLSLNAAPSTLFAPWLVRRACAPALPALREPQREPDPN